jgi:uncharacterized repeat protein (TIGR01451 family)
MNFSEINKASTQQRVSPPSQMAYFRLRASILCSFILAAALALGLAETAGASIIINAPMTDTNSAGWTLGGNPASALMTGNGAIDPVGNGWLRLTNATGNQTGYAYNNTVFDLSDGLLIEFDYATWGGSGADGYSVYLFDAGVSPFNIGAFGGSLGYAQKGTSFSGGACTSAANVPGISGGYVGFGVDEYGNFADCGEGRYLSLNGNSNVIPNTVTIRGSVVGFGGGAVGQTQNTQSYPWIATSAVAPSSLWYNGTPRPSQVGANYRKVRILITPAPNPVASVWVVFGYASPLVYTPMITNRALPAISTSQQFRMGYAASTGGATNHHEIRNLLVSNQTTTSAIDLAITKTFTDITTGSITTASVGDSIRYTVIASNTGPNNVTATGVGIQDTVPTAITGVAWTCAGSSGATCGTASGSGNNIDTTANLPLNGYVTYTITGSVGTGAPSLLSNTASLVIPGSITDFNSNNNSVTVSIPVNSDLSTSTKTWIDLNGGDQNPGDVIQYTITLNETANAAASGVVMTDTFPAALTNLAVTSCPTGTCNIAGQLFTASNVSVPANGSVSFVISTTIAGVTALGTLIDNCATITNPSGVGDAPCASTVTVSASAIPAQGNKPLYLYGAPGLQLSRTPTPGAPAYVYLLELASVVWTQAPVLQANSTLDPSVNPNVPVNLYLASNNAGGQNRDITVSLACSSGGTVLTANRLINLSTAVTPQTFNLLLGAPLTCTAGNSWVLTIRNNTTGNGSRELRVYPVSGGNISRAVLPTTTVIQVGPVTAFDAAYPGGSTPASFTTGTVYLRSKVTDPFGSADIASANIQIDDPNLVTKVSITTSMGAPVASDASSKTFEYAYLPVPPAASGFWKTTVIAQEGLISENTPTDSRVGTFKVEPSLMLIKSAQAVWDPINLGVTPKIIPGSEMVYTVNLRNSGYGSVDSNSLVIIDAMPANTVMCAAAACFNTPVQSSCITPPCGLTFAYPADVTYSCSAPATPCPNPDAAGWSANVTGISINPKSSFYGTAVPASPKQYNFQFKVKIK